MVMEKRSLTGTGVDVTNLGDLVKYASDAGRIVTVNMDGFMKQADGRKPRHAIVIIATGDQADKLRDALKPLLEE